MKFKKMFTAKIRRVTGNFLLLKSIDYEKFLLSMLSLK